MIQSDEKKPELDRISNALAESWFKSVKTLITENNTNLKCGRVITKLPTQIDVVVKASVYNIPNKFDRKRQRDPMGK
jgi:hypothetical protein